MKLRELEVGAKVIFGSYSVNGREPEPLKWIKADQSGVLISEHILEQMAFDSPEGNAPKGNASYQLSNLRQFLNASSDNWYTGTHEGDQPPRVEDDICGFLLSFTDEELICLLPYPPTGDIVSIPSRQELGGVRSAPSLDWFQQNNDATSRKAEATESLKMHTRHRSDRPDEDSWWYWIRDDITGSDEVGCVNRNGTFSILEAKDSGVGVRPLIYLDQEQEVAHPEGDESCWKVIVQDSLSFTVSEEDLLKILNM